MTSSTGRTSEYITLQDSAILKTQYILQHTQT
jgi:hypothetical protein